MAEPDDLLAKADALMARHRLGRPESEVYAEIPVLNDVVDRIAKRDDLPVLVELAAAPIENQEQADADNLRASLLEALQPAIDELIDARLKEGLEPLIERAFNELRRDLQLIAGEILRQSIRRAVEQELDRRKSGG